MQHSYEIAVHRAGALSDEEEHVVALALRVGVVVVGGGRDPSEAGAAVERSLRSVAPRLRPERGDSEVLRGVAKGKAPAVGLGRCTAAGARAVAEGWLHEVGGAAFELDAGMRAAGPEADNIGYVPIVDVRVAALGLCLARGRAVAAVSQFKAAVGAVGRPDGRVRVEDGVEACVVAARVVRGAHAA